MRLGFLVLLGLVGATPAFADEAVRTGAAAFGDWRTDAPGARRLITPADLPAPFATHSTANMSQHEARTSAEIPKAPSGFTVEPFATGLNMPRVIRVAPNGDIFVAETGAGSVPAPDRPKARSSPPACSDHTGSPFTRQDQIRSSSTSRRRTPLCAFPIAAET
jgi:glucose/arabinose dehydrogenase